MFLVLFNVMLCGVLYHGACCLFSGLCISVFHIVYAHFSCHVLFGVIIHGVLCYTVCCFVPMLHVI